jgi:hypothetical protein
MKLTSRSLRANTPVVRRIVGILLSLLIWTSGSGLMAALHHWSQTNDQLAHHSESTCSVCLTVHAPAAPPADHSPTIDRPVPTDSVATPVAGVIASSIFSELSCRGPPAV